VGGVTARHGIVHFSVVDCFDPLERVQRPETEAIGGTSMG
jgi:hypothetical protein